MGKSGGGGGRNSGREQGETAPPFSDTPNVFLDELPGNKNEYVEVDFTAKEGVLLISIEGDAKSNPDDNEGYYMIEHSGVSINENLKGVVFINPTAQEIRKEKERLIDRADDYKQAAKNSKIPGIMLNSANRIENTIQKIIKFEKDDKKTASKALAAGLDGTVKSYIHKSQLSNITSRLPYRTTGDNEDSN